MSEPPPDALLWNIARGAMATKALGFVADLRIADALADGPRSVAELAADAGVDEDALYRFLRALASDGVFAEEQPRVFSQTLASELLRTEHPDTLRDFAHLFGDVWYRTFAEAGDSLRTGDAAFPRVFNTDFWAWLAQHPDEGASFNRAMAGGAEQYIEPLLELDWRDGETVVDVGGGNGSSLVALLRHRPNLRGVVFDLPETANDAEELVADAGLSDRCTVVPGSFFERVPAGDTYVLSKILHDWDDEHAASILRTIATAAPPHARLVIRDAVIQPGNEPHASKWLDLLMLVLLRGRERAADEWHTLLGGAGFRITSISDGLIEATCS